MRKILYIILALFILLYLIPAIFLGILSFSADDGYTKNMEGLYNVVNKETSLLLNKDNAKVIRHFELGLRDTIYIVEFDISNQYRMELQQNIMNDDMWIRSSQISSQKLERYVFDYVDDFKELEKISLLCRSEEAYLYLQVHEDSVFSMEFCVAAWDASEGVLHYFKMDT